MWRCKCSCGNEKIVQGGSLRSGATQSCGCLNKERTSEASKKDITNQRFGRLVALYATDKRSGSAIIWHCVCDCGNECDVAVSCLTKGDTQSCGCLRKEQIGETHKKDIAGLRFGKIVALYATDKRSGTHIIWHCICDCGNECDVSIGKLTSGHTQSCGCIHSFGEQKIASILETKNINFKSQYTRNDCRYSKTNAMCRFDFALFDDSDNLLCVIEYNGIQHYQYKGSGWNTRENFEKTVERDKEKYALCKQLNIPLYIIKYNDNIEEAIENILSKI